MIVFHHSYILSQSSCALAFLLPAFSPISIKSVVLDGCSWKKYQCCCIISTIFSLERSNDHVMEKFPLASLDFNVSEYFFGFRFTQYCCNSSSTLRLCLVLKNFVMLAIVFSPIPYIFLNHSASVKLFIIHFSSFICEARSCAIFFPTCGIHNPFNNLRNALCLDSSTPFAISAIFFSPIHGNFIN